MFYYLGMTKPIDQEATNTEKIISYTCRSQEEGVTSCPGQERAPPPRSIGVHQEGEGEIVARAFIVASAGVDG